MDIFKNEIDGNCSILEKGVPEGLVDVLLSTISLTCILLFSVERLRACPECLKLIDCFSLTHLQRYGATLEGITQILSEQLVNATITKYVLSNYMGNVIFAIR